MCLIDFRNFVTIHVFGVKESIADISTKLPCLGHVTSCYVMSRNFTSCHFMPRNVTSCHVMSHHVTSCNVMSCHVTSWHVMSRRKSRDGHTTNASLSTDFFHTQLIRIEHDRVRWLSRRLPIPYRISGIWSSMYMYDTLIERLLTHSQRHCYIYEAYEA